jgi:hypothetical protein
LHGEKENFEEYSLFLESAELSFAILSNYLARKWRTCPQTTVVTCAITITISCMNMIAITYTITIIIIFIVTIFL